MLRMCYNCKEFVVIESQTGWYDQVTPAEATCKIGLMPSFSLGDYTERYELVYLETAMDCNEYDKVDEK